MKTQQKGFTLIELLITIAIIATIAAFAIPSLLGYLEGTRQSAVVQNCELAKRVIKAEHVKSYSNAPQFELGTILNGENNDNLSPYEDSITAFVVAQDTSLPTLSAGEEGQVKIAIDTIAADGTVNFDSGANTAYVTCDLDGDATLGAGETETISLNL